MVNSGCGFSHYSTCLDVREEGETSFSLQRVLKQLSLNGSILCAKQSLQLSCLHYDH